MSPAGRNPQLKVLDFQILSKGASLPLAGRNPRKLKVLDFQSLLLRGVVASGGSNSSKLEGVLDFQSFCRSKSSKVEDLGFLKPLLRGAPAGQNPRKLKALDFKSLY